MAQSYTGHAPYTDEYSERVDNAEHLQSGTFGAKRIILYDSSGNEISNGSSGSIVSGKTTVTTAGTAVRITAVSTPCKGVWIGASLGAGIVCYVGDSSVLATASSEQGIPLIPGNQPEFILVSNLNLLWVDSLSNSGKVSWAYLV